MVINTTDQGVVCAIRKQLSNSREIETFVIATSELPLCFVSLRISAVL